MEGAGTQSTWRGRQLSPHGGGGNSVHMEGAGTQSTSRGSSGLGPPTALGPLGMCPVCPCVRKALHARRLSLHALSPDIAVTAAIAAKRRHYAASSDYIGVVWRRRHREGGRGGGEVFDSKEANTFRFLLSIISTQNSS
ncbi:unnamed protein product [Boreogadus saida]